MTNENLGFNIGTLKRLAFGVFTIVYEVVKFVSFVILGALALAAIVAVPSFVLSHIWSPLGALWIPVVSGFLVWLLMGAVDFAMD